LPRASLTGHSTRGNWWRLPGGWCGGTGRGRVRGMARRHYCPNVQNSANCPRSYGWF